MIELTALNKNFGEFNAVKQLDLTVGAGELFAFLGPNGAGKTTTIRMMMGILVPTSGTIAIDGKMSPQQRIDINRIVGYLPDAPIFYDYLKGREIIEFIGEMHGQSPKQARQNAEELMAKFELTDASEEFAANYSLGMKKKLGLACALIHEPKVLILDEPTNALDPRASKDVQHHLVNFVKDGGTVFLSTHLLDMAQRIANRIGIIHQGQLVAVGTMEEISMQSQHAASLEELFLKLTDPNEAAPMSQDQ